ncbi:hypothetical protein AgCh_006177 [Apium graveolens]
MHPMLAKSVATEAAANFININMKVQDLICDEIDDAKYCLIVDESRDISKREQMAIVVRFRERFLDLVHVKDTTSLTLKTEICDILSHHNPNVQNIRGQGYDGVNKMRAHQLQLALVAATREVPQIHTFFQNMVFIINAVTSSSKRHDELQANQIAEIEHLKKIEEIQTDVPVHPDLKNLSTLGDLCHGLVTTGKADMYPLVDRLLRLVLTLPASTAKSEQLFLLWKL